MSKYDNCISQSINSRIYAYSWYLDIVADDWNILVLGDYLAVMPLPKRQKYFINYIYVPAWTQQLGVFSKQIVDESIIAKFLNSIPKKFKKTSIYLNDQNRFTSNFQSQRDNFVLNLEVVYTDLVAKYSKKRRQTLRKINKENIHIVESEKHQNIFPFYYEYIFKKSGLKEKDMQKLDRLLSYFYKIQKAFVIEALTPDKKSLGGAIFLIDNNRIYYLFSALSTEGKKEQAMTYIIDYVINKYAEKPIQLDFEGSMIPGIASFFKSFGAVNIPYYVYEKPFNLF